MHDRDGSGSALVMFVWEKKSRASNWINFKKKGQFAKLSAVALQFVLECLQYYMLFRHA